MGKSDIYSRVDEIIEEMRGDWKEFFMSPALDEFARHYIANLIAGVYDSLRVEGAQIAPSLVETEMARFVFEREYDPNSENQTAFCASTDKVFKICVNGAGALVNKAATIEEKFETVIGLPFRKGWQTTRRTAKPLPSWFKISATAWRTGISRKNFARIIPGWQAAIWAM